jgi:hypothetical protein
MRSLIFFFFCGYGMRDKGGEQLNSKPWRLKEGSKWLILILIWSIFFFDITKYIRPGSFKFVVLWSVESIVQILTALNCSEAKQSPEMDSFVQ